jgi:hypothetical protein
VSGYKGRTIRKERVKTMGFLKWLGRVTLWVVFLPIGIWRSVRHGRRQHDEKLIAEFRKAHQV